MLERFRLKKLWLLLISWQQREGCSGNGYRGVGGKRGVPQVVWSYYSSKITGNEKVSWVRSDLDSCACTNAHSWLNLERPTKSTSNGPVSCPLCYSNNKYAFSSTDKQRVNTWGNIPWTPEAPGPLSCLQAEYTKCKCGNLLSVL